jgi:hypothetical protein
MGFLVRQGKMGISEQQEWFSQGYLYFIDGIWRHMGAIFCNWKWIKWFRRLFKLFFIQALHDHAPLIFWSAFTSTGTITLFPGIHWTCQSCSVDLRTKIV